MSFVSNRNALRPDTAVVPVNEGRIGREVYIREMKACCLKSLKEEVVKRRSEGREISMKCRECGGEWRITSSMDERVLAAFVTHGGPRVGGGYPAA